MTGDRADVLIAEDPAVMSGQPVVAGTRVPVTVVLDSLAEGMTEQQIGEQYPALPDGSVAACLRYASHCVAATITAADV